MKNALRRRRKYAFNINECNLKKKFIGSLKEFQSLNRDMYDEIENNDISIKKNKQLLKNLKKSTVKELVYTNAEIPNPWKTKFDYKNDLLKMFVKDPKFLFYLGHGGDCRENTHILTTKETEKNNSISHNILSKTPRMKKAFPKIESNTNSNNNKTLSSAKKITSNNTLLRTARIKEMNISDKEIFGLLDEFKHAYPLFDKGKGKEIKKINKVDNIMNNSYYHKNNTDNNINNKNHASIDINSLSSFPSINQKHNKRQDTFRQNIFENLIPTGEKNGINSGENSRKKKKEYNNKIQNNNYLFLDSDNEAFNKKIDINNPLVLKSLEGINFYGPYYSYCPPCGNKNLEFYNNLEHHQCMQIIKLIKKTKGRKILWGNKDNNENEYKKNNNNNYIFKNKNDNDEDSDDNTSLIHPSSKNSYGTENNDVFN